MGKTGKPFTSIQEQVDILNRRGVETDSDTPRYLLKEGYYQVVNGYKKPFIDEEATNTAGDDRFKASTHFNDIYGLFLFDRNLREMTFHYLLRIEALMRTVCSYTFAEHHKGIDDYLDQDCFASEREFLAYGLDSYRDELAQLQSKLHRKARKSTRDFIVHHRDKYGGVPIWVLVNDLTFGNIEHFFNLMKPEEQKVVCKRIVEITGKTGSKHGYFDPQEARIGLNILVKMRNMCAHDERLYCASIGQRQKVKYMDALGYASRYMTESDFQEMTDRLVATIKTSTRKNKVLKEVLEDMGFEA